MSIRKFGVRVCKKLKPLFLTEALYLKARFWLEMGYRLDLKNPKTFSEKIQWLKLYDRRPEYTTMVDKYAVKDYVARKIGAEHVIPTLGVWDTPEEIEWDKLPACFVLKTTHGGGSGGVIICKDKSTIDKQKVVEKLRSALRQDIAYYSCEWPYKNVKRRIIAEEYLDPAPNVNGLTDYKWYCFDGEPKYCQVIQDRYREETIDFFDTGWNHQVFVGINPAARQATVSPVCPVNLDVQIEIAKKLSKDIPFSRIDLYEIGENEFFGEITLYPASGFGRFKPEQLNEILGQMLTLPGKRWGGVIVKKEGNGSLIIAEPDLLEYKLFCFDGNVHFLKVNMGRATGLHINFYTKDFELLPFGEAWYPPNPNAKIIKPNNFEQMVSLAEQLSSGIPLLRVDMYNVNGKLYLGELTFFPASGLENYEPAEWDYKLGEILTLPREKYKN